MDWVRRLWFLLAVGAVLFAVAVFLGAVYGGAGLGVESVTTTGATPTNASANCDDVVVRNVDVTVVVTRNALGRENPQLWDVGVTIRATVFESVKQRQRTLSPGSRETVTIPFTNVREKQWAPEQRVEVVAQVVKANAEIAKETVTTTLEPVKPAQDC